MTPWLEAGAAGERSRIGPICSNGTAKMSCSTNASRSVGERGVQHHEQCQSHRVVQQRLLLGIGPARPAEDRIRHMHVERVLAAHRAGAQHVQTHPRDDGGQPAAQVANVAGVRAGQP